VATPNASADQSLENIQRFIAVLTATIEQVHAHAGTLDEHADAIEDQDGDAQDAATELADALTDFESGLERSEHDALEEVQALQETARLGAAERMARAQGEVESAQSDFDSVLDDGAARIEEAHSELDADGFDALARTMEALEGALEQDQQEAAAAFDTLESALDERQTRMESTFAEAVAAIEETANESRNQEFEIGADVNDGLSALEGLVTEIDAFCSALDKVVLGLYETWREALRTEGLELVADTAKLMQDAAEAMQTLTDDALVEASDEVLDERFVPHLEALGELLASVEGTPALVDSELLPLVDDLEKALGVVETIGSLLAALE
jgi:predicted  nucleic acid-binding Zn-ribbon protein